MRFNSTESLNNEHENLVMPSDGQMKITLLEIHDETTSYFLEAEIKGNGDLLLSGQDCGKIPEEFWGDSDYEYWLTIPNDQKGRVYLALIELLEQENRATPKYINRENQTDKNLLVLLKHIYHGRMSGFSELQRLLRNKGIKSDFYSYI